jgi:hypothetical protein
MGYLRMPAKDRHFLLGRDGELDANAVMFVELHGVKK